MKHIFCYFKLLALLLVVSALSVLRVFVLQEGRLYIHYLLTFSDVMTYLIASLVLFLGGFFLFLKTFCAK